MKSLKVRSELAQLEKIRNFIKENLKEFSLSEEDYFRIELSVVEICTNIIRYAYPGTTGDLYLKTWHRDAVIYWEIKDNGVPFNPTQLKDWDIKEMISLKKKGGLGIFLARKLMDGFSYRRDDDQNVLTISKRAVKKKSESQ
jgi:sigma-B regulation protein RsbU (phosphoserine phosphatase)